MDLCPRPWGVSHRRFKKPWRLIHVDPNFYDLICLSSTQEPQCLTCFFTRDITEDSPHPEKCHWLCGFGGRSFISEDMKPMCAMFVSHCRSSRIYPSRRQSVRVGWQSNLRFGKYGENHRKFEFSQLELQETPFPSFSFWFWSEKIVLVYESFWRFDVASKSQGLKWWPSRSWLP